MMSALSATSAAISSLTAAMLQPTPTVTAAAASSTSNRTTAQDTVTLSDAAQQAYRAYQSSSDGDSDAS